MKNSPERSNRPRIGLKHLLYAMAVIGASLGLCGPAGIGVAFLVLTFWWQVFSEASKATLHGQVDAGGPEDVGSNATEAKPNAMTKPSPGFTLVELLVVIAVIGILVAILLPAVSRSRPHIRQVGKYYTIYAALNAHVVKHGNLPPALKTDAGGRPLYGWRVLILPELGYQELYDRFQLDEPWDSPHNRKLLEHMPYEFASYYSESTSRAQGLTTCCVVTGSETLWSRTESRRLDGFQDDPAGTLLLVEMENRPIPWTAPHDPDVAEAAKRLTQRPTLDQGHWARGFFWSTFLGRLAFTADGRAHRLRLRQADTVKQLCDVTDGRPAVTAAGVLESGNAIPWRVYHYGNVARLIVFLVVIAWPVFWLKDLVKKPSQAAA